MASTEPSPAAQIDRLLGIMERLRSPDGCPWDQEQSLRTLRPFLIEEAYEVIDAIDEDDRDHLREELGDLLLQVVFQSQICGEEGSFTFDDVAREISDKLIRRHPHVFGGDSLETSDQVLVAWHEIKKTEKHEASTPQSVLDGAPNHLPALSKALDIQKRAARVGFDWPDLEPVQAKLSEELEELQAAIDGGNLDEVEHELGDVLFSIVNLCRFLKCDPEMALRGTVQRFRSRFSYIEEHVAKQKKELKEVPLDALEALWCEAKEFLEGKNPS